LISHTQDHLKQHCLSELSGLFSGLPPVPRDIYTTGTRGRKEEEERAELCASLSHHPGLGLHTVGWTSQTWKRRARKSRHWLGPRTWTFKQRASHPDSAENFAWVPGAHLMQSTVQHATPHWLGTAGQKRGWEHTAGREKAPRATTSYRVPGKLKGRRATHSPLVNMGDIRAAAARTAWVLAWD